MRSFALVCALAALVVCSQLADAARLSNRREWQLYKRRYGKVYDTPEEDARRFGLFMKSKAEIHSLQDDAETHKRGLNHLSDWTEEELKRMFGARLPTSDSGSAPRENSPEAEEFLHKILENNAPLPAAFDWRKTPGRVSKVKDQGPCGSAWAFAAVGVLEGQEKAHAKGKNFTELSGQELVDCSMFNVGCNGGVVDNAMLDIARIGGVEGEQDYPYVSGKTGEKGKCTFSKEKSVMTVRGSIKLPPNSEETIKLLVVQYGPVSVGLDGTYLVSYDSGIYQGNHCTNPNVSVTHTALIVGYGTDSEAGDFWIVKNSWGEQWGERGYFRITRGKNTCGISMYPVIALF